MSSDDKKAEAWAAASEAVGMAKEAVAFVAEPIGWALDTAATYAATTVAASEYARGQEYVSNYEAARDEGATPAQASDIASKIEQARE